MHCLVDIFSYCVLARSEECEVTQLASDVTKCSVRPEDLLLLLPAIFKVNKQLQALLATNKEGQSEPCTPLHWAGSGYAVRQ